MNPSLSSSTNPSIWETARGGPGGGPRGPLAGGVYDACVIGGGIAGLSAGYLLAREGARVAVLDAHEPGTGETSRTTAHLSSVPDRRFASLEGTRGIEACRMAAESHLAAIDRIEAIVREEAIDCEFMRVDGYLFGGRSDGARAIEREHAVIGRMGLEGVDWLDGSPLPGHADVPCLRFPRQGQFHPLKYIRGLADAILRRGGEIAVGVHAESIAGGEIAKIETTGGPQVSARTVVVATNTPFNNRFTIHTKQAPYLSYAVAAPIPEGEIPRALYWDTEEPFHYVRTCAIEGRTLLIVGGEDHKTGQAGDHEERYLRLEAWGREAVPAMGPVERRWSGQVLETMDGLAFIGRNPGDEPNVFIATGDSGLGMTHGTIAGILLCDLIRGRSNPWAALYEPSRFPLRAMGDFARENANVALQYTDWLTSGDSGGFDDIPPGGGAVIRGDGGKLAAFRDLDGQLHVFSASCPHLGCVVAWNASDRTWDCPCHGSRFDCRGHAIQGPANRGLARAELSSEQMAEAGARAVST
jgi:glycine/D-amino acid oxidase-like deaminating enzyme/nitrite reductase/ring-hydroxylating ferredoxin subunit